jgi:RNA polymerase sigma-70 factor, ECF subfamily
MRPGLDYYRETRSAHHPTMPPPPAQLFSGMVASTSFSRSFKPVLSDTARAARDTAARQEALHDATLVRRFNEEGDETAFVEITTRYREKMYAVAFSLLKNRADAEEIAQDTFIRAHRGLANFRGDSALGTWLHRIALNLSRNRYWYFFRRHQHATRSFDCAFSDENPATLASLVASSAPSPVQEATTTEFSTLIDQCMDRLGAGHRDILTRRNVLNNTYDEIAQALAISVGTVKSRIARARTSLRVLLARACPEFGSDAMPSQWFDPIRPSSRLEVIAA